MTGKLTEGAPSMTQYANTHGLRCRIRDAIPGAEIDAPHYADLLREASEALEQSIDIVIHASGMTRLVANPSPELVASANDVALAEVIIRRFGKPRIAGSGPAATYSRAIAEFVSEVDK